MTIRLQKRVKVTLKTTNCILNFTTCWFVQPTTLRFPFSIAQVNKLWNLNMKTVVSVVIDWLFTTCEFDKYLKAHVLERSTPTHYFTFSNFNCTSQQIVKFKYENSCVCSHSLTIHNMWIWQIPKGPCIREVHPHETEAWAWDDHCYHSLDFRLFQTFSLSFSYLEM